MARIGINGFGRMGRLGLRAGWNKQLLDFIKINEITSDAEGSAHLLKFDSVHGQWSHQCSGTANRISVEGREIYFSSHAAIEDTDWSNCDIVIEATGVHHKSPQALQQYFEQGVKKGLGSSTHRGRLECRLWYQRSSLST